MGKSRYNPKQKKKKELVVQVEIDEDEVDPMSHHVSVRLGNRSLLFSGCHYAAYPWYSFALALEYISHHIIYLYDMLTEKWIKCSIPDAHKAPPPTVDACAAVVGDHVYMFGGGYCHNGALRLDKYNNENYVVCINMLWKLSRKAQSFQWSNMTEWSQIAHVSPRRLASAWGYKGKFWVFGGSESPQQRSQYIGGVRNDYLNELISFDTTHKKWEIVKHTGAIPSPRHGHAATLIKDKLYLFGGRDEECFNDLYELHLETLAWTSLQTGGPCKPVVRHRHTFTALSDKCVALHGGEGGSQGLFADTWVFDVTSLMWKKYRDSPEN